MKLMEDTDQDDWYFLMREHAKVDFGKPTIYNFDREMLDPLRLYHDFVLYGHRLLKKPISLGDLASKPGFGLLEDYEIPRYVLYIFCHIFFVTYFLS